MWFASTEKGEVYRSESTAAMGEKAGSSEPLSSSLDSKKAGPRFTPCTETREPPAVGPSSTPSPKTEVISGAAYPVC